MDYFDIVIEKINKFGQFGIKELSNGTFLVGKAPHVAPSAWLHAVFAPLSDNQIEELQDKLGILLPDDFRYFLKRANGISIFSTSLSIYGHRDNYERNLGSVWQPFDIITPNKYERPKDATKDFFFIGGYDWDGSMLYIDLRTSKVYRCSNETSTPLNEWENLGKMLVEEVDRLIELFDSKGIEIDGNKPTTPPAGAGL